MAKNILEISEKEFDDTISKGLVLVDFWAPWCGPCVMQGPILEKVADDADSSVVITKVNVDDCATIASRYNIRSIPTLILFKNGEVVQQFVGVQQKEALLAAINEHL